MIWTGTWSDRGAQLCRKCLGGTAGCKLATSKQGAVAIRKAGSILSCINRSMAQRSDYSHLLSSTFRVPHTMLAPQIEEGC